jgi:CheY-like chemotaxis protein
MGAPTAIQTVAASVGARPVILRIGADRGDARFAQRALENAGMPHLVIRLHDAEEAVKYLSGESPYHHRNAYPMPALILWDLMSPITSGVDLLDWIQRQPQLASIPVTVLVTSFVEHKAARNIGSVVWEAKPGDFSEFLSIVRRRL